MLYGNFAVIGFEPDGSQRIDQMGLVVAIMKAISEQHPKIAPSSRHYNAIIRAANEIVDEFARPHRPVVAGMGFHRWLRTDETGLSSKCMAYNLATHDEWVEAIRGPGLERPVIDESDDPKAHPVDVSDFDRCLGLLEAVPEFRERLDKMATVSSTWAALVAEWPRLECAYRESAGDKTKLRAISDEIDSIVRRSVDAPPEANPVS